MPRAATTPCRQGRARRRRAESANGFAWFPPVGMGGLLVLLPGVEPGTRTVSSASASRVRIPAGDVREAANLKTRLRTLAQHARRSPRGLSERRGEVALRGVADATGDLLEREGAAREQRAGAL